MELRTDARLELLGTVQLLGSGRAPKDFSPSDDAYAQGLQARFASLRGHAGVMVNAELGREFRFRDRVELLTRLSPAFESRPQFFLPNQSIAAAGGPERFDAWLAGLRAFAHDSGFDAYHAEASKDVDQALEPARRRLEEAAFLVKIESYTGVAFEGSYALTATPFLDKDVMLNDVWPREDGGYELRTVFGWDRSLSLEDYFWKERMPAVIWHQYAHGQLDPLADLHRQRIARMAKLNQRVSWNPDWLPALKENIVRAVYIRLVTIELGRKAGERLRKDKEEERNFPKMGELLARLKEYEAARDVYPTLVHFYPRLLEVFAESPEGARSSSAGDWLGEQVLPFESEGQRRRALWYLDLLAERDPAMKLKRGALHLLSGRLAEALGDAEGLLAAPGAPDPIAARYLRACALLELGRTAEAKLDLLEAQTQCRSTPQPPCSSVHDKLRSL